MQFAYQMYHLILWPVILLTMVTGWRRNDWALLRVGFVVAGGEMAMRVFEAFTEAGLWDGQPYGSSYLAIYLVQCVLVTVRPPSRYCAVAGGMFLAGVALSVVYLSYGRTDRDAMLFYHNNLTLCGLVILLMLWGLGGGLLQRHLSGLWGRVAHLAFGSRKKELDRG